MVTYSNNQMFDPNLLFEKSQIAPGMHVADFGCGRTGHVVFPLSPLIGERGVVYAVDIMKDILVLIKKRAAASQLHNIQTIWSDLEKSGQTAIPAKSIDVGFLVNILFQSDKRVDILTEVSRLLKEKARLVVVDWARNHNAFGPPEERLINFEEIKNWAMQNNFVVQEDFFMGPYHRGVIFYRQE
jgi:ubiquinone/menaquinone biosynthesis C-methylase UbiE